MIKQEIDTYAALPVLSTYLGHSSIKATERFVRLTIESFSDVEKAVEVTTSNIISEEYYETM